MSHISATVLLLAFAAAWFPVPADAEPITVEFIGAVDIAGPDNPLGWTAGDPIALSVIYDNGLVPPDQEFRLPLATPGVSIALDTGAIVFDKSDADPPASQFGFNYLDFLFGNLEGVRFHSASFEVEGVHFELAMLPLSTTRPSNVNVIVDRLGASEPSSAWSKGYLSTCGNGIVDLEVFPFESCDDGNRVGGDGCDHQCQRERICGDGILDSDLGEECDDGNLTDGDGCNSFCEFESTSGGGQPVRDLALAKVKAPKKITISEKKPVVSKAVEVTLVNEGSETESIDEVGELASLITLDWISLGGCPAPLTSLVPPKKGFPVVLSTRRKLSVRYDVSWACANDSAKSTKTEDHADFELEVVVDHSVLDGEADSDPSDDVCPRPPSGRDKGCGAKGGGPLRTDVVEK